MTDRACLYLVKREKASDPHRGSDNRARFPSASTTSPAGSAGQDDDLRFRHPPPAHGPEEVHARSHLCPMIVSAIPTQARAIGERDASPDRAYAAPGEVVDLEGRLHRSVPLRIADDERDIERSSAIGNRVYGFDGRAEEREVPIKDARDVVDGWR